MTSSLSVSQRVQAQLDASAPGKYRITRVEDVPIAEADAFTVVSVDDGGEHGAVFQLSHAILEDQGETVAAERLLAAILHVIGEGLPARRVGAYLGYDAS